MVEDHALFRKTLEDFLESIEGVETVGNAADGLEAVEVCAELSPDLVVMDLRMPRLDGASACERLKELYPELRVILYSASPAWLATAAKRAGADDAIAQDDLFRDLPGAIKAFRGTRDAPR